MLLLVLIAWNYYMGNEEERSDSEQVVESARQFGESIVSLIAAEKDRFSDGKYDDIRSRLEESLGVLRNRAGELNINDDQLEGLESERLGVDSLMNNIEDLRESNQETGELERYLEDRLSNLIQRMEGMINNRGTTTDFNNR